eukprot:4498106-Amphidinium_carterae.1
MESISSTIKANNSERLKELDKERRKEEALAAPKKKSLQKVIVKLGIGGKSAVNVKEQVPS